MKSIYGKHSFYFSALTIIFSVIVLIFGKNVAETFNRLYYFERAAQTYINALQTGKKISILNDIIAEKTAEELDNEEHPYPAGTAFLREIKSILDQESSDYSD